MKKEKWSTTFNVSGHFRQNDCVMCKPTHPICCVPKLCCQQWYNARAPAILPNARSLNSTAFVFVLFIHIFAFLCVSELKCTRNEKKRKKHTTATTTKSVYISCLYNHKSLGIIESSNQTANELAIIAAIFFFFLLSLHVLFVQEFFFSFFFFIISHFPDS